MKNGLILNLNVREKFKFFAYYKDEFSILDER